jgi:predicted ester cyclase
MGTLEENKALARRLYDDVFGRGNLDAADEILAPDVVSHPASEPPRVGTDGIKLQAAGLRAAAPDLSVVLEDQLAEGDLVASRWRGRGTNTGPLRTPRTQLPATGRPFDFVELRVDRFVDGRIVECWFVPDRMGLFEQLGLMGSAPDTD